MIIVVLLLYIDETKQRLYYTHVKQRNVRDLYPRTF